MAALACPSMRATTFGFAPALIASEAAVWRRACAVTLGNSGSCFWHRPTAVGYVAPVIRLASSIALVGPFTSGS
jgi:hypothetical protein